MQEKLSQLPKMDELLEDVAIAPWFEVFDRPYVKNYLNEALNQVRQAILAGEGRYLSLGGGCYSRTQAVSKETS